jgi:hypothetical protein
MSTKEKETSLHRVSKEDEDLIYNLVDSELSAAPNDNAQTRKDKEHRREEFKAFKLRMALSNDKPRPEGPKRLCYENLPELLEITGLSYLDILKCVSKKPSGDAVKPQWASEAEAAMCSYCDMLSPDRREKVLALIRRILAPVFENSDFESMTPTLRLFKANAIRSYCIAETKRQTKELGVYDIYRRRFVPYSFNAVELNMVSYLSISFDVSPHWLLGLDETHTVLATNGETETIMDLFCFLPEGRKQMILQAVQTAIEKGGAA